jgi:hypothetical protein
MESQALPVTAPPPRPNLHDPHALRAHTLRALKGGAS